MVNISNLSKSFGAKQVLSDISLSVAPGEIALLLGSSGSGKSTILRILSGLETPDRGSITINGKTLEKINEDQTHAVGMVFQHFNLFEHMTVLENITFPLERGAHVRADQARKQALALLEKYSLSDKAQVYASELSGGQKQRLAIARTIALKPQVICMDEPTSALDPLLTTYVSQSIEELAQQGFSIIVASHDTKLIAQLPCTIYLLREGKLVEKATSQALKASPEKYPEIFTFIKGS